MNSLCKIKAAIIIILCLFTYPAGADIEEINLGVDKDKLVAGSQFTVNENWEFLLEYTEDKPLGLGLTYEADAWQVEMTNRVRYREINFSFASLGSLNLHHNRTTEEIKGSTSFNFNDISISSSLASEPDEEKMSGHIRIGEDWTLGQSSARFAYDESKDYPQEWDFSHCYREGSHKLKGKTSLQHKEEGKQQNITLRHEFTRNNHQLASHWRANEYGSGLVGQGVDFTWQPPLNWLELGWGSFDEDPDGAAAQRYTLALEQELTHNFSQTTLGLGGKAETNSYSTGDNRQEYTVSGRVKQEWKSGSGQLKLQRIQRAGDSPFEFDGIDRYRDLWAKTRIEQQFGSVTSTLRGNYDLFQQKWRQMKGSLQFMLFNTVDTRFTADYNIDEPPESDETAYITTLKYTGAVNLNGCFNLNSRFEALSVRGGISIPLAENEVSLNFTYDAEDKELDWIQATLDSERFGKVGVKYEPVRPLIMVTFQPLEF
ncbi:MAG: hypothetical protein K9L17_14255 [Clostridiales bacterium]|nr:hypothetical protein [Clostridiales bacterium]